MMRPEYPATDATRRRPGWAGAGGAALALLALAGSWSACTVDDRNPGTVGGGTGGAINSLLGGSGGETGADSASVGSVGLDPQSIDLGPVVVGSPVRARLRIANTGAVVLGAPSVTLANGGPAYSVLQNSCEASLLPGQVLPPGQTCEVRLQLLADHAGTIAGQLAIDAAGSTQNVPLSAVGNDAGALILAPAAGSSDNFGSVRLGSSTQAVFNLTNPGTSATGPLTVHLFNGDVTEVTGAPGSCVSGTTSLEAGQTCDLHLAFAPTHRGASDAMLVLTSTLSGSVGLPLTGRGVVPGALAVSQPSLDFDGVVLGDAGERALHVSNDGDEALTLLGVTLAGDPAAEFLIQSSDCPSGGALAAGAGCDVILGFRPATSGDGKSAALTIAMSGGGSQQVALRGAGLEQGSLVVAPLEGNAVDFGALTLGDERTQVFRVSNSSAQTSGPLAISASGDFTLVPPSQPSDCENAQTSLENGASCNLTVKLAPLRRAAQYGSVSIRSPLAKSASLRLKGNGMAPARLTIAQDEINFGRVLTGGTYQAAVTLVNQGDQPLAPPVATVQDASGAASSGAASGFSVENGCTDAIGFQASCALNVHFQPTMPGFPVALLRVESPTGTAASALLFGEVSLAGNLVLAAAEGESADFGEVALQTPKTVNFTLSNPSAAPSGRLSITVSSPLFSVDPGTCNPAGSPGLVNGESCSFSVTYQPLMAVPANATLSIQSPGAGGAALSLSGQGRSPANLVAIGNRDFATANIGQAAATDPRNDFTWSLSNDGDLATGLLQVSNSDAADFAVAADGCSGQLLLGHAGCNLSIRFRPGAIGAHTGDLVVTDMTSSQAVTLKMTGNGVQIAEPGESCVNATCRTGVCTGGVCCDVACVNGCQECSTGTCTELNGRETCGDGTGVCFGVNRCALPEGNNCTADNQCGSGNCERKLGGASANDKVCCLQSCANGDQCSANGQTCQQPTLSSGAACGAAGQAACGSGLQCKACLGGGSQCTAANDCCGGCPGDQVCSGGECGCSAGTVDCQDGRCIANRAGACCDDNGCDGNKVCSANNGLCGCPSNAPRDCGGNVCIPNSQCCNCGGPCSTCNTTTGTCGQVPNGQAGQCGGGQVCQNGACVLNNVGLGQACNVAANNCSVGACTGGTCQCPAATPNACGGNRCVNFNTDPSNCGGCGNACGTLGCNGRGVCNCPSGQEFVAGSGCRLSDGQTCTPGTGVACRSTCVSWFADCDSDNFPASATPETSRCGSVAPAGTPRTCPVGSGQFVQRDVQGRLDCCDSSASAFPGQPMRFGNTLPPECIRSDAADHDWNCNGRNEGALTRNCSAHTQLDCRAGVTNTGQNTGDIVPTPQVDTGDVPDGQLFCGSSVGPGTCAFFTDANPSPFGLTGCAPDVVGFTQLPCN
jgi:hypothetical protein